MISMSCDPIRLTPIRDGLEDYEYLAKLEKLVANPPGSTTNGLYLVLQIRLDLDEVRRYLLA